MINQGWGGVGGGRTVQCTATVRRKVVAHKNSVRQLCAANLPVRRTLCARIVRDNCALHTCGAHCVPVQCAATVRCKLTCTAHIVCQNSGAHCVPVQCAATVRCKLAAHFVCQNSARQLCAAYLRRTLCVRTVRQKSNLHTKNAFAATANISRKRAASLRHICGLYIPETLYFGKGCWVAQRCLALCCPCCDSYPFSVSL